MNMYKEMQQDRLLLCAYQQYCNVQNIFESTHLIYKVTMFVKWMHFIMDNTPVSGFAIE